MARIETHILFKCSLKCREIKWCNGLSKYLERYILESLASSVRTKQEITK